MKDSTVNVIIRKTSNYDRFRFLTTNREVVQGHINLLKQSMQEHGNLTQVQPIVVNEHGDVIDGQNRLIACKELGLPVYYSVVEGLNIEDARQMNILHRNWNNIDYLKSYAEQGNQNYLRFLKLLEESDTSFSVILTFIRGGAPVGMFADFKSGELELSEELMQEVRGLLDLYTEVSELLGRSDKSIARSLYIIFHVDGYDHARMLRKIKQHRTSMKRFSTVQDNLRQFEEVYNHGFIDANRVRLY